VHFCARGCCHFLSSKFDTASIYQVEVAGYMRNALDDNSIAGDYSLIDGQKS